MFIMSNNDKVTLFFLSFAKPAFCVFSLPDTSTHKEFEDKTENKVIKYSALL